MNKYTPYIINAALVIVIIVLFNKLQSANKANDQKDTIISEQNDSLKYHRNNEGRLVAEKAAAIASTKEIAKAYGTLAKELKDEFDVKLKDMKAYVKNTFEAHGSGNAEIHNHYTLADSTGKKYPYWELKASDAYLDFSASVFDSLHVPYTYRYSDTVTTVISSKRNWIFGRERLVASSSLKNPNAKVTSSTNILIDNTKVKRFVLAVGVSYDPLHNAVFPAVHFGYKILQL